MQKKKNIFRMVIALFAFTPISINNCHAQNLSGITDKFETYSQNTLQEKLFVHTDRSTYLTGEILWFKIYNVDGFSNKPLNWGTVAYVDVIDDKQNMLLQAKITLNNGSGNGSLFIPVTVANGNYKLRAYTSWMKNFSPAYYFEKTITVINPQTVPDANAARNYTGYDLQFFPEGGNLVNDIQSKVAVKAIGTGGKGIDFTGFIINQKNDTVASFASFKFGMGHFQFTPAVNNTYRAAISFSDNKTVTKELPVAANGGFAMQLIDDIPGQLDITVRSKSNPADNVYIFIHTRQLIKVVKEAALNNGAARFTIDKSLLDEGVSHITIFNGDKRPVCERLYFKRPSDKMIITAASDQPQYGCRKKVTIPIAVKNQSGNPLNPNLSMAVYRSDGLQSSDQSDIISYFWLSSDLQGQVESPGYYFSKNSLEADAAADNLMLTQGWRRFEWNDVLNTKLPAFKFLPETYGHIITGKITTGTANTPANRAVAYLAAPGKRVQLFTARSDSSGRLLFNTRDLYTGEIMVQPAPKTDSAYRIDILSPFSEQYSTNPLPSFVIAPKMQERMEERNVEMQVQNLYAGDSTKQFEQPLTDSFGFYQKPSNTYLLDNYTRFSTMEEVLREYVKEVNIVRPKNKFQIKILAEKSYLYDPLVLVDGIPVFDANKLMAVDPLLIKRLDVVPQRYFYGPTSMEGILSFTSYKGDLAGLDIDPRAVILDYEGMQLHRVFYSPVYSTPEQIKSRLADFRNLLFWSPSISANSKKAVSFYTSDQEGEYIGIVQGITANGEAGSCYFRFTVKK